MIPALFLSLAVDQKPQLPSCFSMTTGKARGLFDVSAELGNETVAIDADLDESRVAALSFALHGEAKKTGATWRFFREDTSRKALLRDDADWMKRSAEARVAFYDKSMRPYLKSPEKAPYFALQAAIEKRKAHPLHYDDSALDAQRLSPASGLLASLLRKLSVKDLEKATVGKTTVFSNNPVKTEFPLGDSTQSLREYGASQEKFAVWSAQAISRGEIAEAYQWAFPRGSYKSGPRTIQLTVDRHSTFPFFSIVVYDPDGGIEAQAESFPDRRSASPVDAVVKRLGKVSLPLPLAAKMQSVKAGSDALRPGLLDPVVNEPLDVFASDILSLWGRAKGYDDVVACVPDALYSPLRRCVSETEIDLDLVATSLEAADCEAIPLGKTLVVRPRNPLQEEAIRVDRRPLSRLFQAAKAGKLDAGEMFAYHSSYVDQYDFSEFIPEIERPISSYFGLGELPNWKLPHPVLAILGAITIDEKRRLENGGSVPLEGARFGSYIAALSRFASAFGEPPRTIPPAPGLILRPPQATFVGTDLDRSPSRIAANAGGCSLSGSSVPSVLLVRPYSRAEGKYAKGRYELPGTVDIGLEDRSLASYDFDWLEVNRLAVRTNLGSTIVGPFDIESYGRRSSKPVPKEQVPGWPTD